MTDPLRTVTLHFNRPLQTWDGFGFNYVEACQVRDYAAAPQDYSGFSALSAERRHELLDLVFGPDGLQPGLLKIFLDCWHQPQPPARPVRVDTPLDAGFDHETTTRWLRTFAREGTARSAARGQSLQALVTLYGPPAWMTRQGFVRGRDLKPAHALDLARYLASWAHFLRTVDHVDVRAVSLHNEGEDWSRWPDDGATAGDAGHDYNLYWPPAQVVALLPLVRQVLDAHGLGQVAVSPGETTNWRRFHTWGYADAIAADPAALAALGLITSHGFHAPGMQRWSADHRSAGSDLLRARRPDLHAWTTSTGWGTSFLMLIWEAELNIYSAKLNGFIPWAGIQNHDRWTGGDPNPHCAIVVHNDGSYRVNPEYYVYKHLCHAGRPGTRVATVAANDSEIIPLAFARGDSPHPDAAVVANVSSEPKRLRLDTPDCPSRLYTVTRTTVGASWQTLDPLTLPAVVELPPQSVTSYHARG